MDGIVADLSSAIRDGQLKPGDRLPTQAELASSYGVARMTVTTAIRRLKDMGLISSRQGRGAFVSSPDVSQALAEVLDRALDYGSPIIAAFGDSGELLRSTLRRPLASVVSSAKSLKSLTILLLLHREERAQVDDDTRQLLDVTRDLARDGVRARMEVRCWTGSSPTHFILIDEADIFLEMPGSEQVAGGSVGSSELLHLSIPSSDPRVAQVIFATSYWFSDAWAASPVLLSTDGSPDGPR